MNGTEEHVGLEVEGLNTVDDNTDKPVIEGMLIDALIKEFAEGTPDHDAFPCIDPDVLIDPVGWLCDVKNCSRDTLVTGLALLSLQAGLQYPQFRARLCNIANWAGLSRRSTQCALSELEEYGLIDISRPAVGELEITLIDPDPAYEL